MAALAESASQSSREGDEAHKAAAKAQVTSQRLEADVQRLQRYIAHLETANRQGHGQPVPAHLTSADQQSWHVYACRPLIC